MWRGGGLLGRPFSQQVGGRLVALLWDHRIVQATHMLEIALLLHDLKLALRVLEVLLRLLEAVKTHAFRLQDDCTLLGLRAFGSEHGLDSSMVLGREGIRLGAEPLTLDLEHHDLASEGLEFVGFRLLCEVQGGCGLVDEVDSLVWEEVLYHVE